MYERIVSLTGHKQRLVVLCFSLSGFSALTYQVAWSRLLATTFGSTDISIAAVLAAYMGGLAVGSLVAGRVADRIANPVRVYAYLEGAVAVTALLVPELVEFASLLYGQWAGDQPHPPPSGGLGQTAFYFAATFLLIGLPTALMGATLPIIARHVVRERSQIGSRIGAVYAANTAGAVAGSLLSAFWLLPLLGISGTVWIAASVNALIFLVCLSLSNTARGADTASDAETLGGTVSLMKQGALKICQPVNNRLEHTNLILLVMLISGAVSFTYEILWTRLLAHILGSSMYALATMLAAFLAGIAVGGAFGGWVLQFCRRPSVAFAVAQIGIAASSMATWHVLESLAVQHSGLLGPTSIATIVMLPPAVFMGATYPIAVRIITRTSDQIGRQAARVYTWNTAGAIVGVIFASLIVLPKLGFQGTIRIAVLTNLTLALAVTVFLIQPARRVQIASMVALALVALLHVPDRPRLTTRSSSLTLMEWPDSREWFYAVGRASTVLLEETDFAFELRANGLPEAQIPFKGSLAFRNSQRWLGLLSVLARPDTRSMMVVGLGGGVALEGIPPTVTDVDVIELEEEVVAANHLIQFRRSSDRSSRSHIRLILNDARNALQLTNKKYDAIVSQPSHPWTSGSASLFTTEFVKLAKEHLNANGTLLIWMNASFLTPDLLQALAATVQANFSHVRIYQVEPSVLHFLASDKPIDIERQVKETGRPLVHSGPHYAANGILNAVDVAATLLVDERGVRRLSAGAEAVTDDHNRMSTDSRWQGDGLSSEELSDFVAPYDPLLDSSSSVRRLMNDTELIYLARRWLADNQHQRLERLVGTVDRDSTRNVILALLADAQRDEQQWNSALAELQPSIRLSLRAWWLLVQDGRTPWIQRTSDERIAETEDELMGSAATVLRGIEMYRSRNWESLRHMEKDLGSLSSTDLWYSPALELRARWRLEFASEANISQAAALVERALSVSQNYSLYELRAEAAFLQRDMPRYIESVIYTSRFLEGSMARAAASGGALPPEVAEGAASLVTRHLNRIRSRSIDAPSSRLGVARRALEAAEAAIVRLDGHDSV